MLIFVCGFITSFVVCSIASASAYNKGYEDGVASERAKRRR